MRECICCQCAEEFGEFRDYIQCQGCKLYGHEKDDFYDDADKELCNKCFEDWKKAELDKLDRLKPGEEKDAVIDGLLKVVGNE